MYLNENYISLPNNLFSEIMLITAPCGYGKTTYSLNPKGLIKQINENGYNIQMNEVGFLTTRTVIKNQQLKNKNAQLGVLEDETTAGAIEDQKINITTVHQFSAGIKQNKTPKAKVIILDEIHSLFAECVFADSLVYLLEGLKENGNSVIKIGLTATPDFLLWYISEYANKDFQFRIIDKPLKPKYQTERLTVNIGTSAGTILKQLPIDNNHKALVYMRSAKACYTASLSDPHFDFLISKYNESRIEDRYLSEIMLERPTLNYIINNEKLPADINVLFVNSAYREGMNIKDESVKYIICESVDMITIEQIIGRIRNNTEEIYIVANSRYRQQSETDRKEYFEIVNLKDRFEDQKKNKKLRKGAYEYNGELKINIYAKAYLRYISESYIQLTNKDGNYKYYKDHPQIEKNAKDYFKHLQKYSKTEIKIEYLFDSAIALSHRTALRAFSKREIEGLNKPLRKQDKDEICACMDALRNNGKPAKGNTVKAILENNGYIVEEKRNKKERGTIIKPAPNV